MSNSPSTFRGMHRAIRTAGFTLIELMVVLIIIAVIIAIVLPALGSARKAARSATTRNMMTQISNAAGVFSNDNRRSPGYFSAREMGDAQNLTQGLAGLQNVMLDLAGGIAPNQSDPTSGGTEVAVQIGPGTTPNMQVWVVPDRMGSAGTSTAKLYFVPDAKHWPAQNSAGQQVGTANNVALRSVVDDFGNPILAWVLDDTAVGQIRTVDDFAAVSIAGAAKSRRFYWATNSAFLGANALGNRAYDQTDVNSGSMIRTGVPDPNLQNSLCGILGSPSFPYRDPAATAAPTVPASARAPLVLQSAGGDGIFFGRKDRGAKQFTQPYIDYQMGFVKTSGAAEAPPNLYTDKDGKRETLDVIKLFDDIIATGGN